MENLHGFIVVLVTTAAVHAAQMVPFVIPADIHPDSEIAMQWHPLTEQDRLSAKEYFANKAGQRVRLWGVNLSFDANFPARADANRIAKRLAVFGVNSVRCHHMDTAVWPRGIWDQTGKELHPEALDRLDYFIDALAKHGIYTDLNLHVGKKHSEMLGLPAPNTEMDKMVTIFTPQLIEAQEDYARRLLTHKNPYRGGVTYAEDYAVAIVEITNENSLFMWGAENTLRTLPPFYADILTKQFNQWLQNRYQTQTGLSAAWLLGSQPLGENLLRNPTLKAAQDGVDHWSLEQHAQCKASAQMKEYRGSQGLLISIAADDGTGWHLQFNQGQLNLHKGRVYTIEFDAAGPDRPLTIGVLQAHEPWKNLGFYQSIDLGPEWKTYRFSFTAAEDDTNARLSFYFGGNKKPFYLANIKLRQGVEYGLLKDESLNSGSIRLYGEAESHRRKIDRMLFLAETEKRYFDGMKAFIQNDLHCKAMVAGTIVFGPLGLYAQSDLDFIDSHAYWQHPRFPNKDWDPADWLIDQKAMSDYPEQGTLYELAAQRLSGKPFTVTEYNHPAPLDAQAECVPMIASFAAVQDWDGVWLYTYSHSNNNWDREHLNSFFDIDTNPAKWGFMLGGAYIFRQNYLHMTGTMLQNIRAFTDTQQLNIEEIAQIHLKEDRNMTAAIQSGLKQNFTPETGRVSVRPEFEWNDINNQGLYLVRNERCSILTGHTDRFSDNQKGYSFNVIAPDFAALTIVTLDGKPIDRSVRILITACGRCENTGMQFSQDRRTLGRNWGNAPVLIEPVEGEITLPNILQFHKTTCKAIRSDGTVGQTIESQGNRIELKTEYGTMWYLVERTPDH